MLTDCEDQVWRCGSFRSFLLTSSFRKYEWLELKTVIWKGAASYRSKKLLYFGSLSSPLVRAAFLLLLCAAPGKGQTCTAVACFSHTFRDPDYDTPGPGWYRGICLNLSWFFIYPWYYLNTEWEHALYFCLESMNMMIGFSVCRICCKERFDHPVHVRVVS